MENNCPICRSESIEDGELSICLSCSHIFQTDLTPSVKYDYSYVHQFDTRPTREMSLVRLGFVKAFIQSGRLLDVGYGKGDFLKIAEQNGFDVAGHDVHGVDFGIKQVPLVSDDFWDMVTFYDSLEHLSHFNDVRHLSKRTKYILVSYPKRPESFPHDRALWKHYKPGEHLHYFSVESISRLFKEKRLYAVSDVEDCIRKNGEWNIFTAVFGPC